MSQDDLIRAEWPPITDDKDRATISGRKITIPTTIIIDGREVARHGHVWPLPGGLKSRCGGPAMCPVCRSEQVERDNHLAQ